MPESSEHGVRGSAATPFTDRSSEPHVQGVLHSAAGDSGDGLVLTHGAGSDANAVLLVALAEAFVARGVTVLRCDLPFRQARRRGPPSARAAERDRQGLRHAVGAVRARVSGRVLLGGQSYGGRQASMVAAAEPALVSGLILLSYPLHPPGRPGWPRTAHFPQLQVPVLFIHGTADPFGSLEELRRAADLIPAPTGIVAIHGARHDLGRAPAVAERVAAEAAAFLRLANP